MIVSKQLVKEQKFHKSLKLRIYPNTEQESLINQTFGCCRKLYNEHLQEKNEFYIENILPIKNKATQTEINKIYKTFKPKTEKEWKEVYPYMTEVSSAALQQARMDCDQAFVNFFKSKNGLRKGKSGFPKFKSKKDNRQSYREVQSCKIFFEERLVQMSKIGKVKFNDRKFPKWWSQVEKLCSMTISKSCSGNYYVSILFEISPCKYKVEDRKEAIGLDFSPAEMYVSSENQTGKDFGYIAQKQAHSKQLRKLQRRFARKKMLKDLNSPRKISSKNREKARVKLARLEEHIANSRRDWIEKETLRLVKNYDRVVVEDLNLKGISKFLRNAKNMNDTSWATFVRRLEQKGKDYNCKIVKADRYFPSSQVCSNCGFQYRDLKLSEREWTCPSCSTYHIRDMNAAVNLKNYVPLEERELKPVENEISNLVDLALQGLAFEEAGSHTGDWWQECPRSLAKDRLQDCVTGSSDTIDMSEVAKVLNCGLGRNKLFELLRAKKVFNNKNQPYQKYVNLGLFRIIETRFVMSNGEERVHLKTVVFQKGLDFIRRCVQNIG